MLDEQFWLRTYKLINEYAPHIEVNATNDEKLEFSILLLLLKFKSQTINSSEYVNSVTQIEPYHDILKEIDKTIEHNQVQFNHLFESVTNSESS